MCISPKVFFKEPGKTLSAICTTSPRAPQGYCENMPEDVSKTPQVPCQDFSQNSPRQSPKNSPRICSALVVLTFFERFSKVVERPRMPPGSGQDRHITSPNFPKNSPGQSSKIAPRNGPGSPHILCESLLRSAKEMAEMSTAICMTFPRTPTGGRP